MRFGEYYKNRDEIDVINEIETINEDASLINGFLKLIGSTKISVSPEKYSNYIIGSNGFSKLLNLFSNEVLQVKQNKIPKKRKFFIDQVYQGIIPNVNKLKRIKYKTSTGVVKFWEPVEKINGITAYHINSKGILSKLSNLNQYADIVLWDIDTIDDFSELEDSESFENLGWEEGKNQFVLSVNNNGIKLWMGLIGMPLQAWIKASRIGAVNDPYGVALRDDIALAKNIGKKNNQKSLTNLFIPKDLYNKLVPQNFAESYNIFEERKLIWSDENNVWQTFKGKMAVSKFTSDDVAVDNKGNPDPELQKKLDDMINSKSQASQTQSNSTQKVQGGDVISKQLQNYFKEPPKEIAVDSTDVAEKGLVYTFNNGGRFYIYKIRNAPSESQKYKIAYDEKGKKIISKIPEINKILSQPTAKELK